MSFVVHDIAVNGTARLSSEVVIFSFFLFIFASGAGG
jgi:hypothetical protein